MTHDKRIDVLFIGDSFQLDVLDSSRCPDAMRFLGAYQAAELFRLAGLDVQVWPSPPYDYLGYQFYQSHYGLPVTRLISSPVVASPLRPPFPDVQTLNIIVVDLGTGRVTPDLISHLRNFYNANISIYQKEDAEDFLFWVLDLLADQLISRLGVDSIAVREALYSQRSSIESSGTLDPVEFWHDLMDELPHAVPLPQLDWLVKAARASGYRVAMTSGIFDLFHAAHVHVLSEMPDDHLNIVAVNADKCVCKGKNRPVMPAEQRVALVHSHYNVDAVCVFHSETPRHLVRQLRPDVYIKGVTSDDPPELEGCNWIDYRRVKVPKALQTSTTDLIKKIQAFKKG